MNEGSKFGSYELIKRVAFGGMAEIHLAKTTGIGGFEKLLALKVIHPKFSADQEFIDMLIDEAKLAVQLSHANIAQVFDLGQVEDTYYIAMEFVDGKDLYQILVKCSELDIEIPFDVLVATAMETANGLQYAHTRKDNYGRPLNLVHRDISPQNLVVSYDGEVKIVDFGIAKASQRSKETESGIIKGKFFYMSPEQAWGEKVDARTDVFSLGICLYEMITGEMLYNEEKALALLEKVRKAEIPSMRRRRPDLPEALEKIVLKALSRDRDQRYQSAGELQRALSSFLYRSWPSFDPARMGAFMKRVFGDQRFVLPMPVKVAPAEEPTFDSLMNVTDFDRAGGESVIYDLEDLEGFEDLSSLRAAAPPLESASSTVNERGSGQGSAILMPDDYDDDEDDDDEDERTIMEPLWAAGALGLGAGEDEDDDDEGDATAILSMSPSELAALGSLGWEANAGRAVDQGVAAQGVAEPPTSIFSRDSAGALKAASTPVARPSSGPPSVAPASARPGWAPQSLNAPVRSAPSVSEPEPHRPAPVAAPAQVSPAAAPVMGRPSAPAAAPTAPTARPSAPAMAPTARPSAPAMAPAPVAVAPRNVPTPQSARASQSGRGVDAFSQPTSFNQGHQSLGQRAIAFVSSPLGVSALIGLGLVLYAGVTFLPALFGDDTPPEAVLVLSTTPAGASVEVDGELVSGITPVRVEGLSADAEHEIFVKKFGYESTRITLKVSADLLRKDPEVVRRITLKPAEGTVKFSSTPFGADIYVNGRFLGKTPFTKKGYDRTKRKMRVKISLDGYRDSLRDLKWGNQVRIDHTVILQKRR